MNANQLAKLIAAISEAAGVAGVPFVGGVGRVVDLIMAESDFDPNTSAENVIEGLKRRAERESLEFDQAISAGEEALKRARKEGR